jgi:hypothetical protein
MRIIDLTAAAPTLLDYVPVWNVGASTTNKATFQNVVDLHELQVKGTHNLVQLSSPVNNYNSGQYNTLLGTGNTVTGTSKRNLIAGSSNSATGDDSFVVGTGNTVTGNRATAMGSNNVIQANYAHCIGFDNKAKGTTVIALGQGSGGKRFAEKTFAASYFGAHGDAQLGILNANKVFTSPYSGVVLDLSGFNIDIHTDSVMGLEVHVLGVQTAGSPGSAGGHRYSILRGLIKNIGGTVTIHDVAETVVSASHSGTWTVTATADNTNKLLLITCTGASGQDIRFTAQIIYTQIGYNTFAL